jgi:hypothetical protein
MTTPGQIETAINASKVVACIDHVRNNRIEYLLILAIGHLVGATAFVADKAAGVCA